MGSEATATFPPTLPPIPRWPAHRLAGPAVDSARANLAATFVNAFVNAGFGQDKLVTVASEDEKVCDAVVHLLSEGKGCDSCAIAPLAALFIHSLLNHCSPTAPHHLHPTPPHPAGALDLQEQGPRQDERHRIARHRAAVGRRGWPAAD